jgi:hypothetical protein
MSIETLSPEIPGQTMPNVSLLCTFPLPKGDRTMSCDYVFVRSISGAVCPH